jgi:gluconolactonase
MVNITHVDVLSLAASIPYANELTAIANASTEHVSFISYSDEFLNGVLGNNATQQLVAEVSWDAFHEAGVYNIETGLLYATSNWAGSFDNPINVTAIDINRNNEITSIRYPGLAEANGGAAFYPVGSSPNSSEGQQAISITLPGSRS